MPYRTGEIEMDSANRSRLKSSTINEEETALWRIAVYEKQSWILPLSISPLRQTVAPINKSCGTSHFSFDPQISPRHIVNENHYRQSVVITLSNGALFTSHSLFYDPYYLSHRFFPHQYRDEKTMKSQSKSPRSVIWEWKMFEISIYIPRIRNLKMKNDEI